MKGFQSRNEGISNLRQRIRSFVECGCYNNTKKILEKMCRPGKLSLSDAVSAVFVIFIGVLMVTILDNLPVIYFYRITLIKYLIFGVSFFESFHTQKLYWILTLLVESLTAVMRGRKTRYGQKRYTSLELKKVNGGY